MVGFITFIALSIGGVIANRTLAWGKRTLAKHRARIASWGYSENNVPHRLRAEKYKRVAFVAYMVFGLIQIWFTPSTRIYRGESLLEMLAPIMLIVLTSGFSALVTWFGVKTFVEFTHPIGETALSIRDKQFHKKIAQLSPGDSHGSARLAQPADIGLLLTNPVAFVVSRPQPIVYEVEK